MLRLGVPNWVRNTSGLIIGLRSPDGNWTAGTSNFDGAYSSLSGAPSLSGYAATSSVATALALKADKSALPQAIRVQTSSAGVYIWVFATPFAAGVIPVISYASEDATSGALMGMRLSGLTNTGVTVTIARSTAVSVAGISVLGAAVGVQTYVHLTAVAPT